MMKRLKGHQILERAPTARFDYIVAFIKDDGEAERHLVLQDP
jgi:hypothetical protein